MSHHKTACRHSWTFASDRERSNPDYCYRCRVEQVEAERDKYKADYERCAKDAQRLAKLLAEEETLVDKYKADRDRISESADECHRLFTKVAKERDKYKEALEEIASMPDNRSTHWEDCPHNTCIAARALREP
jgi:chromosome segregation ATPase